MQLRPLGNTGIDVSPIGLGTVKLGRAEGVKYPAPFAIPSDRDAAELLAVAGELGVNLIDTAPAYGCSESRLGQLLGGQREQWVIAGKAGEERDGGVSRFDFSPRAIEASVERSLLRLRTDYIDIMLLHSDGRDEYVLAQSGGLEALLRLKEQGKLRAVGASTKTFAGGLLAAEVCDVVMLTLNPRCQGDVPAIEAAARRGAGVLIKKALISGHVAAGEEAAPTAAACLRLALTTPGVISVIVGTINPDHLRDNVRAAQDAMAAAAAPPPTGKEPSIEQR